MKLSTDHDLEQLERNIALMRAVGRTHMPVPLTTIERNRRHPPAFRHGEG